MMRLTVGITGHRDIARAERARLREEVRNFFSSLRTRFPKLPLELLTPLAEGADMLATEVAMEMGIPITVILPMSRSDYITDFESQEAQKAFKKYLALAEHVISLPARPGADLSDSSARSWQYAQLGVFISNHCQILLALWDGKDNDSLGGTAQVVRYHLTAVMPGFEDELPPASLLADNENDLCYHIVTSRDRPGGEPAQGLEPGKDRWMTSHFNLSEDEAFPFEYGQMLDRLSEFDQDCRQFAENIDGESGSLLENPPGSPVPAGAVLVDSLFSAADWLAVRFQKRVNRSLSVMYGLAVVMGLVFIVYSESSGPTWLLAAFLALFFSGVALHLVGNNRQWHRKYLDYRALAEALRVQFYWNVSGVVDAYSAGFAYDTFLHKQDVELGWIRHVMRTASAQRERGHEPAAAWLPWAIEQWIGDAQTGAGQLGYYTRKASYNEILHRRTTRVGAACLWSGIALAFLMLILGSRLSADQTVLVMIFMGMLPLIAGVREAMSTKKAEKELIKQYRFMEKVFGNARQLLTQSSDAVFKRKVLKALGEAALEEGAEWILMKRERPIEHGGL
jgi:hypothetical protein